jgi:hypothetical protein
MVGVKLARKDCEWTVVDGFPSEDDFEELRGRLTSQVSSGLAKEEPVRKPYSGVEWDEHWYRCVATGETWRLVAPDEPFKGLFKPI